MSSTEQVEALSIGYIARQIETAARLIRVNPAAVEAFDTTADGFFRSFIALLIAIPFTIYEFIVGFRLQIDMATVAMVTPLPTLPNLTIGFFLFKTIQFVLQWIALPVAVAFAAKPLGWTPRVVPFVVAYNWATLLVNLIIMVPLLLYGLGIVDVGIIPSLLLAANGLILYYGWSIVVSALQVPPLIGIAVVAFDFLSSLILFIVFETLQLQFFPA